MNDWHVPESAIRGYLGGTTDQVESCSIEAHLASCSACRASVAAHGDAAGLEATWSAIVDELDAPRLTLLERLLEALGVSPTTARLVSATPSLRLAWGLAVTVAVAVAVVSSRVASDDAGLFLFAAPLVPLLAIAAAFGPMTEPTYEITVAAPFDKVRLLALRGVIVLGSAVATLTVGAFVVPSLGPAEVTWLLPALALASVGLCLMTWVDGMRSALVAGAGWLVLVVLTTEHHRLRDIADRCPIFQPGGQLAAAIVVVLAMALAVRRRSSFDLPGLR